MKNFIQILTILFVQFIWAQVDYSENWQEFYSYNNVKDFIKVNDKIYATADNGIFVYDINSGEISEKSSVDGLSGKNTSSIFYSTSSNKIVIGYETGLIEVIDENGDITVVVDVETYNYTGDKSINDIFEYNNMLYLSTSFGIVVYDIVNMKFGDTYFIGDQSSEVHINQIVVLDGIIYAATESGVFTADISNPNLVDSTNWTNYSSGNYTAIEIFNNIIYLSKGNVLYTFANGTATINLSFGAAINDIKASQTHLSVTSERKIIVFDTAEDQIVNYTTSSSNDYYFKLNGGLFENDVLYLGTQEFGVLTSNLSDISTFEEIHPGGPVSNTSFSISAKEGHLWVVYGGYYSSYAPKRSYQGYDHFNGVEWTNTPFSKYNVDFLVNVTFDPTNINKVYISSYYSGLLVVENDEVTTHWTKDNGGFEGLIRFNGSAFDTSGDLWIGNSNYQNQFLKFNPISSGWNKYDFSDLTDLVKNQRVNVNEMTIDKSNNIFVGTRSHGIIAFNEDKDLKYVIATIYSSNLLSNRIESLAMDKNNRLWIGTSIGLQVLKNTVSVFDGNNTIEDIINSETGGKILADEKINSIAVDGANNKWIGTETMGAWQLNSDGTKVLQIFDKSNSPLPSNSVLKIDIDDESGLVYFATGNGIVAYQSGVSVYSDNLPEVYSYPNPSTKTNESITITGRNGNTLPEDTNIKILDAAGNLVYETNTTEGQEIFGGKVVWNKTNLAGKKVASGIYIVLLYSKNTNETQTTKIAIVN